MLLSIIIPAYNVSNYITNTLISLQKQTSMNFEIILVNDASTDNTSEIIEKFRKNNSSLNIKLINHEVNRGVSAARNSGLKIASGDYLLFLDGDDYVDPNIVHSIELNRKNNSSEIIIYGFNRVTPDNKILTEYFNKYEFPNNNVSGEEALDIIARKKTFQTCVANIVYNREFIIENSLLYTETCVSGEDTEFVYKSLILANEVSFINKVLFNYVIREGSITNRYDLKKFQTIYAVKRIYDFGLKFGSPYIQEILTEEVENMLVFRYIFNYNSCLEFLLRENISNKESINILNNDLNKEYPGLNNEMMNIFENYSGSRIKILLKIKIFNFSPVLYNKLYKVIKL